ncbi:hypothetical protein HAHE_26610 [Haloferula helveola]|uniref:HupE / UreJ protein n=3 Tax=Haloferula helveola TaxID=490095 RepID=A0ABM7RDW6_9BACT|nr:hypothetical protein HAHE_26610 [Haloferula helveola]
MEMAERIIGRAAIWLVMGWLSVGSVSAHSMDQVNAEIQSSPSSWEATVWIDAWAAYPEDGAKVPPGQPGDPNSAGKEWLATLDEADFTAMRERLSVFMKESLVLTLNGERLDFSMAFPGFESVPPELELNRDGNAVVQIELQGDYPAGDGGALELVWKDPEDQPLTIDVVIPREGKPPARRVMRIAPHDDPIGLLEIDPVAGPKKSEEVALFGWIVAGFEHVLPLGLDHILFILGLFFLKPRIRPLLSQSLAFTLAHSITLALVVLGVFTINPRFVESMIALSIAYVGIENLWVRELKPWRVFFVFALGLLHGMGFASVMQELELPSDALLVPLVGFNVGVEVAQVAVLAIAFAVWLILAAIVRKQVRADGPDAVDQAVQKRMRPVAVVASAAIALVGLYWTFERAFGWG